MRKDMSKVIVERPRGGHSAPHIPGKVRRLEGEDGEPLRAHAPERTKPIKTKSLNENLAPLRRFLEAQVGRPWNKVYSEISEHLKATNAVQQHVRDHLEDFVAIKTRMENGVVMAAQRYGEPVAIPQSQYKLFVHPKTGLLRKNKDWKSWSTRFREDRAKQSEPKRMRAVSASEQLHLLNDGGWWRVTLAEIPERKKALRPVKGRSRAAMMDTPYTDVVLRDGLSDLPPEELYGRTGLYARTKKALSKAEKKKLGLE